MSINLKFESIYDEVIRRVTHAVAKRIGISAYVLLMKFI